MPNLKRRLKAVHDLLGCNGRDGFALSRSLELGAQWDFILRHGPVGPLRREDLDVGFEVGLNLFIQKVV